MGLETKIRLVLVSRDAQRSAFALRCASRLTRKKQIETPPAGEISERHPLLELPKQVQAIFTENPNGSESKSSIVAGGLSKKQLRRATLSAYLHLFK